MLCGSFESHRDNVFHTLQLLPLTSRQGGFFSGKSQACGCHLANHPKMCAQETGRKMSPRRAKEGCTPPRPPPQRQGGPGQLEAGQPQRCGSKLPSVPLPLSSSRAAFSMPDPSGALGGLVVAAMSQPHINLQTHMWKALTGLKRHKLGGELMAQSRAALSQRARCVAQEQVSHQPAEGGPGRKAAQRDWVWQGEWCASTAVGSPSSHFSSGLQGGGKMRLLSPAQEAFPV